MVAVFVQLFLYEKFESISLNIIAAIFLYTGIMLGFCIPGYIASLWRINIKHGFLASFIFLAGALLYLLHIQTTAGAYMGMLLWGVGQGIFWLTVNTFELFETTDGERDFYSSMLSAGGQIFGLLGPATATLLIWFAGLAHVGTYTLIFMVAPLVYLLGFLCFAKIRNYHPPEITLADVTHFFIDRTNQVAQLYTIGTGFQQTLGITIVPLAMLFILGTALHVGIYDTFFAVFSAVCVFLLASYRSESNRFLLYGLSTVGIVLATVWLGMSVTFTALIIYTVLGSILYPIRNVSAHVIDLQVMETGRKETDFYATMLLRDFFLWIWRCLGGLAFLFAASFFHSEQSLISVGLYLLAFSLIATFLSAYLFAKVRK